MSTENLTNDPTSPEVIVESETSPEIIPSMDEFKMQLESSFKKINEGEILKGIVIGISETEVTLDLGYYTEGIIKLEELSNNPSFSIKVDVTLGEEMSAMVISQDNGQGHILMSKKRADDILAWEILKEELQNRTIQKVKIMQTVNSGVITYLHGIRAFIPASQLSLSYVKDLETWVGKEIEAIVITASESDNKLVLSGKEVEKGKAESIRRSRINTLQKGIVTTGTVETIVPYGAFVNIGDGLSGLVHISQMSPRRIKSPNEVVKVGDTITVKITDIKDGKVSLSMTAVEDKSEVVSDATDVPASYSSGEEATTGLGDLLKNFKF